MRERRRFLKLLGKGSVVTAFLVQAAGALRAFVPNVLYEPPRQFKIGRPEDFPEGTTFLPEHRLFVFRRGNDFSVVSAVCTHLGCTVQWRGGEENFDCPCHGSIFNKDGNVVGGPAPRALPWYSLDKLPDGQLLVKTDEPVPATYKFQIA